MRDTKIKDEKSDGNREEKLIRRDETNDSK